MGQIYLEHRDEDGFLYVAYSGENTFGHCSIAWQQRFTVAAANVVDDDDDDV